MPLDSLRRIAEVEFADMVIQAESMGSTARLFLVDGSHVDVWATRKLEGRFGFHWERRHVDGRIYRYDNFPDANWLSVSTFPFHFHDGEQGNVVAAPFATTLEEGFRGFLGFVRRLLNS